MAHGSRLYLLLRGRSNALLPHTAKRHSPYSALLLMPLLLVCLFSQAVQAQTLPPATSDDQMGEQAYQSYHGGDIDSISLTNCTWILT
jgi:hypothetical protein